MTINHPEPHSLALLENEYSENVPHIHSRIISRDPETAALEKQCHISCMILKARPSLNDLLIHGANP